MNRYRWWHRLRGHVIVTAIPHDWSDIAECSRVRQRCTCGDQWVFHGFGLYETWIPS